MEHKVFGRTDLIVSRMGFGCARLGGFLQNSTKHELIGLLRMAYDNGITFYDTSDMYSQGESENLLGEAFRHNRDAVVIASKGGYCLPTQRRVAAVIKPLLKTVARTIGITRKHLPGGVTGSLSQDFTPEYLSGAVEASLKRLKTDRIDLYQLHSPPTSLLQSDCYLEVLEKLKSQGKIRYYGVSCETPSDAILCTRHSTISSVQIGVGLLDNDAIAHGIPEAAEHGLAVIARGCLGGGLLGAAKSSEVTQELTPKWETIAALQEFSNRNGRSLIETALQFALGINGVTVTLAGMRTMQQLRENIQYAATAPGLSSSEFEELRSLSIGDQTQA